MVSYHYRLSSSRVNNVIYRAMDAPTTKVCRKCGVEKPIDQFRRMLSSHDGYTHVCQSCINFRRGQSRNELGVSPKLPKGSNPALAQFTPRELLEELKSRGYRGELQYTYTIKI